MITSRKRSYRVRPHPRPVPSQEEVGETQVLGALLGVAEMAAGLTDMDELLAAIVRIAPGLVRVDRCAVLAYDEGSREFRARSAFGPGGGSTPFEGLVLPESDIPRVAQRLVSLRLPVLLKSRDDSGFPASLRKRLGMRSALIAPVVSRDRILGAIWLDDTRSAHYFTSQEINIVQGIATELGLALDRARLAERLNIVHRRFEALASALADGVLIVDGDLRIIDLDAGAEALLGWQASEIRGRRVYEVFDITEAEARISWRKDAAGPAPAPKELSLRAHDGLPVSCTLHAAVVRDRLGEISQILYAVRKKPGTKGYAERAMDSLDQLGPPQGAAPPE